MLDSCVCSHSSWSIYKSVSPQNRYFFKQTSTWILSKHYTFNLSGQSLFIQLYIFIILIFYLLLLPYRIPNPINFYLECLFWFLLGELGWKYQQRENHGCQCFLIPTVNMPDLLIRVISFSLLVRSFIYNILFWETTPFFFWYLASCR